MRAPDYAGDDGDRLRAPLNERFTVLVLAEAFDGALVAVAVPVGEGERFAAHRGAFTVTAWMEDADTVRLSVRSRDSGAVAYAQGGPALVALATELGLMAAT